MDYFDEDDPNHNAGSGEIAYPDIDETIQYPWQGSQPLVPTDTSVIDPRLYRGLFSGNDSQAPAQTDEEQSAVDDSLLGLDNTKSDSSFEESSEDESLVLCVKVISLNYS